MFTKPLRWRPQHRGVGQHRFAVEEGRREDVHCSYWMYRHRKMDPKPIPKDPQNPYFSRRRIWNPIAGNAGVVARKVAEWGYPQRKDPPPTGIRQSREYFPHFCDKYFPEVTCKLVLDSVLNNETTTPEFLFPCEVSVQEISNYLKNIYGFENIVEIKTRNIVGRRWKNEIGYIRQAEDVKLATVFLDAPVKIELKQVKGSEDGAS